VSAGARTDSGGASVGIRDLTVRYPGTDRDAVAGVSVDVPAGAFVVLLGPSGCGKSTLLRTVNRLVIPQRGSIEVDGRDVASVEPEALRRGIGYVIQAVGLFPHMSVAENIAVVPQLLGWSPHDIAARIDELLELVRLEPGRYRNRFPRELSGGEQQRVGVARALAARPRVLLMDEPFGAIDAIVRQALQDETLRIHRALGTTILFVTHDVDEALRIADRIVVMKDGRVEQDDTPLRVLAKPATLYVEALLDAQDTVRRLQLLCARDAMRPPDQNGSTSESPSVAPDDSLRAVLARLLEGSERVAVVDAGCILGTISFVEIRAAIVASEA
jgi:osmoprotectant transport system ATP-binding protein